MSISISPSAWQSAGLNVKVNSQPIASASPLIDEWVFIDGDGDPLELNLTTYPHRIDCETRIGTFTVAYVDIETLMITLPSAQCGVKFNANLDKIQTDRRGGVLRLTGDIRRNVAYTTNAHIVSHLTNALDADNQSVQLHLDASEGGKALLLNITPRLGFNRYIPDVTDKVWMARLNVGTIGLPARHRCRRNIALNIISPGGSCVPG